MIFENTEGLEFVRKITKNTIDLILTDPPYIISRQSGMQSFYEKTASMSNSKTEEEWREYKDTHKIATDAKKELFLQYGTIYGKKYSVKTDFGAWDGEFTLEQLELFIAEFYRVLRKGGTMIIFFDIWKLSELRTIIEKVGFKQIRFIEWIKTNPQPLNSNVNYLTNCREVALTAVKGGKPTFNSKYDVGIYKYPIEGKNRFHPTQKNVDLFVELIEKHSNANDLILDCFAGSGTTARACKATARRFIGCELNKEYYEKASKLVAEIKQ